MDPHAAIESFHHRGCRVRRRIPAIKLIASALTIGSGGSAGREGPDGRYLRPPPALADSGCT